MTRHCWALGACLVLAACQDFGGPIGDEKKALSPQEQRMQALEARLADTSRRVENLNFASQTQGLSRLEAEVRGLRGEVERLRYEIDSADKRNRELYQDLDRRIAKMENEGRSAKLAIAPQMANAPPVPPTQEEESAYLAVFDQLKAGKYDESIGGFRDFLEKYPQGRYADNAWYWLGESHYVKRDYDSALKSFHTLLEGFPSSAKAPDALLKVGMAQLEKKQKKEAKETLQKVISDYPNTNAATVAKQRLEQLK